MKTKRISSLMLSIVLIFSMTSMVYAESLDADLNSNVESRVINEFELLKSLSNNSDEELFDMGFDEGDVAIIRNYKSEYIKHLTRFKALEDEALFNLGYSEKQIRILRNFTGTEFELLNLAASLSFNLSVDFVRFNQATQRTDSRLFLTWTWSRVPLIKMTDIVALTWNNWFIRGHSCRITYARMNGAPGTQVGAGTFVPNSGPNSFGGGFRFPMTLQDNTWWGQSGIVIFSLESASTGLHSMSAYAEYGRSTLTANPSFSASGISISFSAGVTVAGRDWADRHP